jgi:hypothetical protein
MDRTKLKAMAAELAKDIKSGSCIRRVGLMVDFVGHTMGISFN